MKIEIYTDGGCRKLDSLHSTGPGSWGYVMLEDDSVVLEDSSYVHDTTNNRMELQAVTSALKALLSIKSADKLPMVTVNSDSMYVINGITVWIKNWKKKNFAKVKNVEFWKDLDSTVEKFNHNIKFVHVKGHNGNIWNEYVDEMCTQTIINKK